MLETYNYSNKAAREKTVADLLASAKLARSKVEPLWKTYQAYWDGVHKVVTDINEELNELGSDLVVADPFTQIESQIDAILPEPIFRGRDNKTDSQKAEQRQYVVQSILYKNEVEDKLSANERCMRLFGDSFFKVYYDAHADFDGGNNAGDIVVERIDIEDFFPDPNAKTINDCEYVDYAYYLHFRKIERIWGKELKKAGLQAEDLRGTDTLHKVFNEVGADMVEVVEHWYKDNDGDIACSIQIDGKEVKFIEKYWQNTKSQNKNFPFVQFYTTKNLHGFWNISELKAILPYIDAADKLLQNAMLNMGFQANDQIVVEENALAEGEVITNEAGAQITVKDGKINSVRRLGGLNKLEEYRGDLQYLQNEIQKTCRNYDSNMGGDTTRQTTASGLAMLRADAGTQADIKGAPRLHSFKRMVKLIDWSALEYYDDDRLIYIGTPSVETDRTMTENLDKTRGDIFFQFNSEKIRQDKASLVGIDDGVNEVEHDYYYPAVDVEVNASSGIKKSKSFTIQALQSILQTPITTQNYKIVIAIIKELELPQSTELIKDIKKQFEPKTTGNPQLDDFMGQMSQEQQAVLRNNPQLMRELAGRVGSPQLNGNNAPIA